MSSEPTRIVARAPNGSGVGTGEDMTRLLHRPRLSAGSVGAGRVRPPRVEIGLQYSDPPPGARGARLATLGAWTSEQADRLRDGIDEGLGRPARRRSRARPGGEGG